MPASMIHAKINKAIFALFCIGTIWGTIGGTVQAAYEISDGTVKALYHFNGDLVDSSGTGANGTAQGNAAATTNPKLGSGSLNLDGAGDYSAVGDFAALDMGSGNFSISAWVKHDGSSTNSYPTIFGPAGTWSAGAYGIRFDNLDAEEFSMHINSATPADPFLYSPTPYSEDTWYLYTFVRSGSTVTMYINGTSVASGSYSGAFDFSRSGAFNIGWSAWDGANGYWKGQIDEVGIFNKALSGTDILYLYNSGNGNEICTTASCAATTTASTSTAVVSDEEITFYSLATYVLYLVVGLYSFRFGFRMAYI